MFNTSEVYTTIMARLIARYGDKIQIPDGLLQEAPTKRERTLTLGAQLAEAAAPFLPPDDPDSAVVAAQTAQGKWVSAGGVVMDKQDGVWGCYVVHPKGGYGGVAWTLPKGRIDAGETPIQAAVREVLEETGMKAKVLPGKKIGAFVGSMSVTIYFLMMHVSGTPKINDEVDKIEWLPLPEAIERFKKANNKRDAEVVTRALGMTQDWA